MVSELLKLKGLLFPEQLKMLSIWQISNKIHTFLVLSAGWGDLSAGWDHPAKTIVAEPWLLNVDI